MDKISHQKMSMLDSLKQESNILHCAASHLIDCIQLKLKTI